MSHTLTELLPGAVAPATRRLLVAGSGGDPQLLRGLVLSALGLGALAVSDGEWRWVSPAAGPREPRLTREQLVALRTLIEPWLAPWTSAARPASAASSGVPLDLTQRQLEILGLLGDGLTVQAIARRLCLSPRTVAKHQERMYRKFGTSDRLTTVLQAQRLGLLPPAGG
jgi:DNA-binding CsgD family transcriptional regulator